MEGIDKGLSNAKKSYDEAFKQLSTGRGNAISLAESMRELGAKTVKKIDLESSDISLLVDDNK